MTTQPIRAVYTDGQLRLLDPVELAEGQEIRFVILPDYEGIQAALNDLLANAPELAGEEPDEEALAREIEAGFHGQPPLSDTIITERREGP